MKPPLAHTSFVVKGLPCQLEMVDRCDQRLSFRHSPPRSGWTKAATSTKPSSSPEFGEPSGPSLSKRPKLTEASFWDRSDVRNSPVLAPQPASSPLHPELPS